MSVEEAVARNRGLSAGAERVFEAATNLFVVLLGCTWAWSIATARVTGDKHNIVSPATAAVSSALGGNDVPSAAYVVNAINDAVVRGIQSDGSGESGKLLARFRADGGRPGIVRTAIAAAGVLERVTELNVITLRPASDAHHGRLGLYFIGTWPRISSAARGGIAYRPPNGFIEVTPANENARLSAHFRVRDFLTHDQPDVWPKYEVVSLRLVDKLELVLADLRAHGINPEGVYVMSGFRTPQYNRAGGDPRGRASLSRHMYGDAADIYIDNGATGSMSDLNHDGRVDINDARVILAAVNRVERSHPALVGGCGLYGGNGAHGPFVHIDTRGYAARWTGTGDQ